MIPLIYLVIFLEGYAVLSTELLAIRLLVPFVGSGTDTVSIIIAGVLLPLALGYYWGGRPVNRKGSPRKKLVLNLVISLGFLSFGLSYLFLGQFFGAMHGLLDNRTWLAVAYAAMFIVVPVFLLGQTIPLISHFLPRRNISTTTSNVLFFSTCGSFAGAILSTLIFMTLLGVNYTVMITTACLVAAVFLLTKKKLSRMPAIALIFLVITIALNSGYVMKRMNIVENNLYNTMEVYKKDEALHLRLNRTNASAVKTDFDDKTTVYPYIDYMENLTLPERDASIAKKILVLGAGGFTFGRADNKNNYTYVDIDSALQKISEEFLIREKLPPNKRFVPMDARAFLIQNQEKFDVIIIDIFQDPISAPENLNTVEFFEAVKEHLAEDGVLAANFFASPSFADAYSYNLDATLRSVFPPVNRQVIRPYNYWKLEGDFRNVIYSYFNRDFTPSSLYKDNKSTFIFDTPKNVR